ncbi:hypothetical protein C8R43DRAFT_1230923 [Mycena crocata]|nr:hypothetical protein C8R43DRAFT_1230923 [Mycena crocata]
MPVPQHTDIRPVDHIPVIDFKDAWNNDPAGLAAIAIRVRSACLSVGFFYVKNHGIPEAVTERTLALSKEFFELSEASKLAVYQPEPTTIHMGYRPLRDSNADPNGHGDLMEGISFQWQERGSGKDNANQWPVEVPAMRDGVLEYYEHGNKLAGMLYRVIALAMGVEEDFFQDKTKSNFSRLRLLHYPEQKKETVGTGAHSDFGTFTILLQQAGINALEVLNEESKEWIEAPPMPGMLIINLGDQASRWTNGHFKSAKHRVVSRPGSARYSAPLFYLADFDVPLEPIESFVSAETPRQYEVLSAKDQLMGMLKGVSVN